MRNGLAFIIIFAAGNLFSSCVNTGQIPHSPERSSEYYTTTFPRREISQQLEMARKSILRIISTSFYDNYKFKENRVTLADVKTNNPEDIAARSFSTKESTAGTSIVLQQNEEKLLLISCNHIVSSPDTLISYYEGDDIPKDKFIKSLSIKRGQNNLIFAAPLLSSFKIIASDSKNDLALLTSRLSEKANYNFQPLNVSLGNSDNIQTGSLLYVLGFPKGHNMVTRGLASTTENYKTRFFITDALFNPGISGGLVLASKNNFRSFEWVGMARSATASKEDILVPSPGYLDDDPAVNPYSGIPYVQQKTRISYGITQVIPANNIDAFLKEHKRQISRSGFSY